MGRIIVMAGGWIAAIILGGLLIAQIQQGANLRAELDATRLSYDSVKEAAARVAVLEEKTQELEAMISRLDASDPAAAAPSPTSDDPVAVPEDFKPSALLKNMLGGKTGAGDGAAPTNPMAAMLEGERGQQLMESMLPAQVDMQYSDLFAALDLPEEREAALREVLLEHARAGAAAGMAMMRGEEPAEGAAPPSTDDLFAALGEVLSDEELAEFTEYQAALPERLMRQQFDMQMDMMAGDLAEEVRNRTVDVLVENLLAAQPSETVGQPDFDAMRAAFDDSIVQLEQELSPEDAARVRTLIEQQRAGIDMAARMFGKAPEAP